MTITGDVKRLFHFGDNTMATPPVAPAVPVVAVPAVKQTWLQKLGHVLSNILSVATKVATVATPAADIAFAAAGQPALANLFNLGVDAVQKAEAASSSVSGTGAAKLALVVSTLTPDIAAFEQQFNASVDQTKWVNAVVAMLQAITVHPSA